MFPYSKNNYKEFKMKKYIAGVILLCGLTLSAQSVSLETGVGSSFGVTNSSHTAEIYPMNALRGVSSNIFIEKDDTVDEYDYRFGFNLYPNMNYYMNASLGKVVVFGSEDYDLSLYTGYTWYFDDLDISLNGGANYYSYGSAEDLGVWDINRLYFTSSIKVKYKWQSR